MTKISGRLALLICLLCVATLAFAASEAEYKKLSKTYTLHADGSQEYRYSMELTLFTHTAMNGTYGESFIVYNPDFQELKIHTSYTRQKDGNIVKAPANAFVEVLPRNAADAPAYNQLKEMVVVHTGLELGATIYLDYSVLSKPGYLPALDIYDELLQSSPVKEYTSTIVVPESAKVHYALQPSTTKPAIQVEGGVQTISWTLRNLPAASRELFVSATNGDVPFLSATTYASEGDALKTLYKQFNPKGDSQIATVAESITEGKARDTEKLQALLGYVTKDLANSPLTLEETGFRLRPADAVINTAYGTAAEKVNLLTGLLHAVGIEAIPTALYRANTNAGCGGLKAVRELFVIANADGKRYLLSPASDRMATAGQLDNVVAALSLATGEKITIDAPAAHIDYKAVITLSPAKAEIQATSHIGDALRPYFSNEEAASTSSLPLKADNGYLVLPLPNPAGSLANSHFCRMNSTREKNLMMPYKANEQCNYTIQIPEGMELRTPLTGKTIENAAGKVVRSIQQSGNTAQVTHSLVLNKQLYTPAEYSNLRALLTEWGDENGRTLVFSVQ